ncbi:MAG: hypothetical protein ACE5KM_23635 [Planctomycetaceae bacterium]
MQKLLLLIARLALSTWVGAVALFVVAGVREVNSDLEPLKSAAVKNALVATRFPAYYAFGFSLVILSLACVAAVRQRSFVSRLRRWVVLGLVGVALALMVIDYVWIYSPLLDIVTAADQVRPAEFFALHEASKWINGASVGLCLLAATVLSWPREAVE